MATSAIQEIARIKLSTKLKIISDVTKGMNEDVLTIMPKF
jgi:hypothetical protein